MKANQYFGANYNDNTYVQKKYVDDTKNITTGYTFTTLPLTPTTPTVGQRAYVTDSPVAALGNFGVIAAGGGANVVPVFYDGTN